MKQSEIQHRIKKALIGVALSVGTFGCVEVADSVDGDTIAELEQAAISLPQVPAVQYLLIDDAPLQRDTKFSGGFPVVEVGNDAGDKSIMRATGPEVSITATSNEVPLMQSLLQELTTDSRTTHKVAFVDCARGCDKRRTVNEARLAQLTLPSLDASGKDIALFHAKLRGATTTMPARSERLPMPSVAEAEFAALRSNFTTAFGDLPSTRVSAVELPTITLEDSGATKISNLKVTMSNPSDAAVWLDWYRRTVLEGASDEKTGTLRFMNRAMSAELFSVTLTGLGVVGYEESTSAENLRKFTFELYCEGVSIEAQR
jgi:hypothetical protein